MSSIAVSHGFSQPGEGSDLFIFSIARACKYTAFDSVGVMRRLSLQSAMHSFHNPRNLLHWALLVSKTSVFPPFSSELAQIYYSFGVQFFGMLIVLIIECPIAIMLDDISGIIIIIIIIINGLDKYIPGGLFLSPIIVASTGCIPSPGSGGSGLAICMYSG